MGYVDPRQAPGARFVAVAILALPLLLPAGPGHITPADVVMAVATVGALLGAIRVRWPYAVPMSIYIGAGVVAAVFGSYPQDASIAILQDVFLLIWAVAIANMVRTPTGLSIVLRTWAWGAVAWAAALVFAMATHQWWLAGGPDPVYRGSLFFDEANIAGNFFALSFFVLLLADRPRSRPVRFGAALVILAATVATGSNAALLSLLIGGAATAFVVTWRRYEVVTAIAFGGLRVVLIAILAVVAVKGGLFTSIDTTSNTLVTHSVGRFSKSAEGRSTLFREEFNLYKTGNLLGRGPASTLPTLEATSGVIVKSAHDDYLATLIERGPLGVVGLLMLMIAIGRRAFAVALRPLARGFETVVRNPAALVGGIVTMAVTATTHETLHYRHAWAFYGLLAGLYLFARIRSEVPARVGEAYVGAAS